MAKTVWRLRGEEIGSCNCSWGCPCQFNALPTHGRCDGIGVCQIARGHYGEVSLDGTRFAFLLSFPGAVHEGKGGVNGRLVGGDPIKTIDAEKTIANFWPFATTLFDYIRRAMPWPKPRSLTNEEVYALTAYILSLNKLIGENDTMNAQTLPKVRMPNRDGFIVRFPDRTP